MSAASPSSFHSRIGCSTSTFTFDGSGRCGSGPKPMPQGSPTHSGSTSTRNLRTSGIRRASELPRATTNKRIMRADGDDRHDGHAPLERRMNEAGTVAELDLAAVAVGAERLVRAAGIDEHAVILIEHAVEVALRRGEDAVQLEPLGEARVNAKRKVVHEPEQRPAKAKPLVPGHAKQHAVGREIAAVVVGDQQAGLVGDMVQALDLAPEIPVAQWLEPAVGVADRRLVNQDLLARR